MWGSYMTPYSILQDSFKTPASLIQGSYMTPTQSLHIYSHLSYLLIVPSAFDFYSKILLYLAFLSAITLPPVEKKIHKIAQYWKHWAKCLKGSYSMLSTLVTANENHYCHSRKPARRIHSFFYMKALVLYTLETTLVFFEFYQLLEF